MKRIIKVFMISVENIIKHLRRFESFVKKFEKICLNLMTVVERSILEKIWFVESFFIFWGQIRVWSDYLLVF